MIVDDEKAVRDLLLEVLADKFECVAVSSAEEALSLLVAGERFGLILSDITMEGMSGLDLVARARELSPESVIILISGEQNIERAIDAMRAGAFDYITKPFEIAHVEASAKRAEEHFCLRQSKRIYENNLEELVRSRTARLDHVVLHDALTELPNRNLFCDRLTQALSFSQHGEQMVAILFLDIDRFKSINDTLGYVIGDQFLQAVAARIRSCLSETDTLARFGSDEFAILLPQIGRTEEAVQSAQCILREFKTPVLIEEHELYVSVSIGISLSPSDGSETQELLKNAGSALFRAKRQGGNRFQLYTADQGARAIHRLSLENDLRRALGRQEFVVHYQPLVETRSGLIVGTEALVRWQHPRRGLIYPAEFIGLAEETGIIEPLGEWVLSTACAQNKRWHDMGLGTLCVSVNLSPCLFRQSELVETVERLISQSGLHPSFVELELTETSIMRSAESTIEMLQAFKSLGIKIAIDDFGSGYSSLSYLKHLPIDILKIDQAFVRDLTSDANDAAIVQAIISLAHNLSLKVKAEGVETAEQMQMLKELQCDEMQGYYLGRPLQSEVFQTLLRSPSRFTVATNSSQPRA